jgi:hypothetical protein
MEGVQNLTFETPPSLTFSGLTGDLNDQPDMDLLRRVSPGIWHEEL